MADDVLLSVSALTKYFDRGSLSDVILRRDIPPIQAVDGVSFDLGLNHSIGVVGESGCGKTTLLRTLIGLYNPTDGSITYRGRDISDFSKRNWKEFRGNVQMIFQDPFNSLDPKFTVEEVLEEQMQAHGISGGVDKIERTLELVELHPPESYLDRRPQQLSGGEKQRVSIARALVVDPEILLADEPVSMLDVSTQASILKLLSNLADQADLSMVYISHDLSTVSYVCDEIHVMYLGRIIEKASTEEIVSEPKHPYARALINSVPIPDPTYERERTAVEGAPRDPIGLGSGCRFRDRCPERMPICEEKPRMVEIEDGGEGHVAACHLYYEHEQSPADMDAEVEND